MKKVNILETTLRDGSYAVDFKITASDTALICKGLEEAGARFIEIGHGVGLNGSEKQKAAATDEQYMVAAKNVLKKAKYGMFCIPGIARLPDLDLARKHGMGFVRVGTNVDAVDSSESFIKKAKDNGMFVAANYMKSYALTPVKFAKLVEKSEKWGADMVYIVDSAGGMFPEQIKKYYDAIRKVSSLPIGFHGHDNLGMAVANCLASADMGIEFIDSSLQGLGRSGGNACTEALVAALEKRGYKTGMNLMKSFEVGDRYVRPLLTKIGFPVLDVAAGYADFHSSYMPLIEEFSSKYKINPVLLIIEACKVDKVDVTRSTLEKIASRIKKSPNLFLGSYGFNRYVGGEQELARKK